MLALRDLVKAYGSGQPPALQGVNLTVAPGEWVALLGPSGAGKTTLLRCLNGLVQPTSGAALYRGRTLSSRPPAELRLVRRDMAMIFQEAQLIEGAPALINALVGACGRYPFWRVALGLWTPPDVALAHAALAQVGLADHVEQLARDLSGGQRQRVALARALVQRPQVILADEPVSNLDPVNARAILDLVRTMQAAAGLTVVMSVHDVELARTYAHRIVGLRDGRLVFAGSPDDLTLSALDSIYGGHGMATVRLAGDG